MSTAVVAKPRTFADRALEPVLCHGWPVFPVDANKVPLVAGGFKVATTDLAQIEAWSTSYPSALLGIPCGPDTFDVLDIDVRDGKGGAEWLKANVARLPATRTVRTRSGGLHLYLKPSPAMRSTAGTVAPGVDIRAAGTGYVVAWNLEGLPVKNPSTFAEWPAWLVAEATRGRAASIGDTAPLAGRLPPSADAVVALFDRMPNPLGETRDTYATLAHAARGCILALEEAGSLGEGDAERIGDAWVTWAEGWEGFAGTDERAKWDDDFSLRDSVAGWAQLERHAMRSIKGYPEEVAATEFGELPALLVEAMVRPATKLHWHGEKPYGDRRWLAYGLLPETGVALLSGQWGVGKTFAAIDLAAAVMTGTAFAGREVDRKGGVLWLAAEGETEVSDRLDLAMKGRPPQSGALPFAWADDVPVLTLPGAGDKLVALVKSMNAGLAENGMRVGLIVVDTVAAAAGWRDEQDSAEAQVVMNVLRRVSRETGTLVVAVDHYGKSVEAGTRGSSAKEAAADAVIALLGEKRENGKVENRRMAVRKLRGGATGGETAFNLRVEDIGIDPQGRPITTCAVDWTAVAERPKAEPVPRVAAAALAVLTDLLSASGSSRVPEAKWRQACVAGRTVSAAETEQDRARCFRRAYETLIERNLIEPGEMVGLPGADGAGALDALTMTGQPDKAGQSPDKPSSVRLRQDEHPGRTGHTPIGVSVVRAQPTENEQVTPAKTNEQKAEAPPAARARPARAKVPAIVRQAIRMRDRGEEVTPEIEAAIRDAARLDGVTLPPPASD